MSIKLGVSLYSFTKEYCSGRYTFEDCVRQCAELGVDGYEIVGTQMLPSYPYVSDEVLGVMMRLNSEYGVRPVCYGANTDTGMRHDRDLNEQELIASTKRDIVAANKLGCRVMRAQYLLGPDALVKIAPFAEDHNVKVGIEIHNPDTPSTPPIIAYYEAIIASGSKFIGFIPDFGCLSDGPNHESYDGALERGASKDMLDYAVQLKYDDVPMAEAQRLLVEKHADEHVMKAFFNNYGLLTFYKNPDLEGLKRIMPYCFHCHGKFHNFRDDGTEYSIPYDKILPIILDSGFDGYIVSEYEGHIHSDISAAEMLKKHFEMERRILRS